MEILSTTGGIAGTNCYLIADPATRQAVLFDAPDHTVAPLLEQAQVKGYDLIGLWLTHAHFDHMADHAIVTQAFPNAKVLLHADDIPKLRNPDLQTRLFMLPWKIPPREPDLTVTDGQELSIGSIKVVALHTPGHASGHIAYHFPDHKILVSGDLIICGAVGRTDLPDSDESQLITSIQKLYTTLPPETLLLPGHCDQATLAEERRSNPYVRAMLKS